MALVFRCPACGNSIQVADEHAGLAVQCPVCQQPFTAPRPGESFASPISARMSPPSEVSPWQPPQEGGRKGMAITALILGILGFCLPPLLLIALILGIIALTRVSGKPEVYGGRGLALAGVILGGLGIGLWVLTVPILLPSLARARELAKRTTCAANMQGLGYALRTYSNDGDQGMPIAAHWQEKVEAATGQVNYVGRIGSKRGLSGNPAAGESLAVDGPDGRELSTTRNLWTMVRIAGSTPQSFVCPSSGDVANVEWNPQDYWDFGVGDAEQAKALPPGINAQGYRQCSYGYQVPYGRYGRPGAGDDPNMVLAADKGPYGSAIEGMGVTPPPISTMARQLHAPAQSWRPWNSPNHGGSGDGEGQNVLFFDNSVRWHNQPLAVNGVDNIYTQWTKANADPMGRSTGNTPSMNDLNLTPMANTDAFIYP